MQVAKKLKQMGWLPDLVRPLYNAAACVHMFICMMQEGPSWRQVHISVGTDLHDKLSMA